MKKLRARKRVTFTFIITTFFTLLFTALIIFGVYGILNRFNVLDPLETSQSGFVIILLTLAASVAIGTIISWLTSYFILRPINQLIDSMKKLANGKYDTRINLGKTKLYQDISYNFNTLAKELNETEMLRIDFINNFSHEFKTPIVSIYGFAKLLNDEKISPEDQKKYIKIIEDESKKLSTMTTNILNLTRIENQHILSDKKNYNLSEQIRNCILLLEKKWSDKNLNLDIDFDEVFIYADENLMNQVWLNLLDNAIKFSNENSDLTIKISDKDSITVSITNQGVEISENDKNKIFNKFYQADKSHKTEGNGIGLSIVKKIIDLHQGKIDVKSENGLTTFTITINNDL